MSNAVIPGEAVQVARFHEGLISLTQYHRLGFSDSRLQTLLARGHWTRVVRGVYDTTPEADRDWDSRRRRAAWTGLLAMGRKAIAVGTCALALQGVAGLPRSIVPEVAMADGRHVRGPAGVRVRRYVGVRVPTLYAGWSVSDTATALVHALPTLDRGHAVAVLDSVLNTGRLTEQEVTEVRDRLCGRRGSRRLEEVWPLVNGLAESPLESWVRLDCVDAGLPPDRLQMSIRDDAGVFVARVDMAWLRADGSMVVAEIDGRSTHATPDALFADRARQNRLLSIPGITVLRFTFQDLQDPGAVARAVRRALIAT